MRSPVKADGPPPPGEAPGRWRGWRFGLAVAALTGAGLFLRLVFLDQNPLWYDEAYTFYLAHQATLAAFFGHHLRQLDFYGPIASAVPLWSSEPTQDAARIAIRQGEVLWLFAATDDGGDPQDARRVLEVLERRARVTFHQAFFHVTLYRLVGRRGPAGSAG